VYDCRNKTGNLRITILRLARVTIVAVEKYGIARQATDGNIIQCVPFARCITKATDTLRIYNTCCFSTAVSSVTFFFGGKGY